MKKAFILLFIVATFGVVGYSQNYNYDVNADGAVTVADVTAIYDFLLGDVPSGDQFDVNGDGVVTSSDVTMVYDYLLGNVHEFVDLGLPSGTLWATMNVGAEAPEEYGLYFAWGETTPKDVYNWSTYKWCMGDSCTLTKYCNRSGYGYDGFVDNKMELDPEDDAVSAYWGGMWCLPSKAQIEELIAQCNWRWTTKNDVIGVLLISKNNGASIFFPAAGAIWEDELTFDGSWCAYWSRTIYNGHPDEAVFFDSSLSGPTCFPMDRFSGYPVRAVRVQ